MKTPQSHFSVALVNSAAHMVSSSLAGAFHQQLSNTATQLKKRKKPFTFSATALSVCLALTGYSLPAVINPAYAKGPEGGVVVGGKGEISKDDLNTIIEQTSQNMAIDWESYNLSASESVTYTQPNAQAISLNRILSANGSVIAGNINANGQVILINPNGLVFTQSSVINVGGIIASGLELTTSDFMNGDYVFNEVEGTEGTVINRGLINASVGGHVGGGNVALIGKQVSNEGLIEANLGTVTLAAGKQAVLTFETGGLLGVRVSKAILQEELGLDAAVVNSGEINAKGGRVLLTASTSQDVFTQAVNAGVEQASSAVVHDDGSFTLGGGADLVNSGSVDVSTKNNGEKAGQIVALGENVTSSGQLLADASSGQAGEIELHAKDSSLLTGQSLTSARGGNAANGGSVKVLGDKVGLLDQAQIDASGANGGEVYIGGGKQGKDATLDNASFTYIGEETQVSADGLSGNTTDDNAGDGGTIIAFAEDTTRIYGQLSAVGGAAGGDGGFIETSGLKGFAIDSAPDVSASNGKGGEWLIDPNNITIVTGGASGNIDDSDGFTSLNDGASLGINLIHDALVGGASVTISTTSLGSNEEDGNISWGKTGNRADLDITGQGHSSLTLNADNNITFEIGDIGGGGSNDSLNLVLNANGNMDLGTSSINTSGGDFTLNAKASVTFNGSTVNTEGGAITVSDTQNGIDFNSSTINTGGGDLTVADTAVGVSATGGVNFNGSTINTDGGAINVFDVAGADIATGNIEFGAVGTTGSINTGSGSLTLNKTTGTINLYQTTITTEGGSFISKGSASFTSTDASITTTGTINKAGGNIDITSAGPINVGVLIADGGKADRDGGDGVVGLDGGDIKLTSTGGNITANNTISAEGTKGDYRGGDKDGDNRIGQDGGAGGDVKLIATNGSVITTGMITTNGGVADGDNDFNTDHINEADGGAAGTITITATNATLNGELNAVGGVGVGRLHNDGMSQGTGGDGGDVTITADSVTLNKNIDSRVGGENDGAKAGVTAGTVNINLNDNGTATIGLTTPFTSPVNINGASGSETLQGANVGTKWLITDAEKGYLSLSDGTELNVVFDGIENLTGGSKDDLFNLASGGSISGVIDGGTGANALMGGTLNDANAWLLTGQHTGTLNGKTFKNIQTLKGHSGVTDTLTGAAQDNKWIINAANGGSVVLDTGLAGDEITFLGMENLKGNSGIDSFELADNGSVSGSIDGGGGTENTLTSTLTSDSDIEYIWALSGKHQGKLNNSDFANIQHLTGSIDNDITDTLTGAKQDNNWTIDSENGGNVVFAAGVSGEEVTFTGMENITGNTGIDVFDLADDGAISGVIDGGVEAQDTLNLTGELAQEINLTNDITGIENLVGEGDGVYTLAAGNTNSNIWNVNVDDKNKIEGVNFTGFSNLIAGSGGDTFNIHGAMNDLTGGDGIDTFNINAAVHDLTGGAKADIFTINATAHDLIGGTENDIFYINAAINSVAAGTGKDTINLSDTGSVTSKINGGGGAQDTLNLTGKDALEINLTKDVSGIENLAGTGEGAYTLIAGNASSNTWDVYVDDKNEVGDVNFTGFNNLIAGSGGDTFNINGAMNDLTGGAGIDTFNINAAVNDLTGGAGADHFVIKAATANITAGSGDDIIDIDNMNLSTGNIDGQTGDNDTLNLTTADQKLNLAKLAGIEAVNGFETGINILQAGNATTNTWNVTSANAGDVGGIDFTYFADLKAGSGGDTFYIGAGIGNLTGGTGADKFTITSTGNISGLIDGGQGSDALTTLLKNEQTVELGDNVSENLNVLNVESITANINSINTLAIYTAENTEYADTLWNIEKDEGGSVTYNGITTSFSNFDHLTGGDKVDKFSVTAGGLSSISMGDGNDTFEIFDGHIDVVNGDAGNDEFTLFGGSVTTMNGNYGIDTIVYTLANVSITVGDDIGGFESITAQMGNGIINARDGVESNWNIFDNNKGKVKEISDGSTELTFNGFNRINGGSGVDNFTIEGNGAITGAINGGGSADTLTVELSDTRTQSAVVNFNGGAGDDIVTITGTANVFSETYQPNVVINAQQYDQLSFNENNSPVNVAINYRDVATVNDNIQTTSLVLNNSAAAEKLYLSESAFSASSGLVDVNFTSANKGDITVQALNDSTLELDSVTVNGNLRITAAKVSQAQDSIITAEGLILDDIAIAGQSDNGLAINVNELQILNHSGEIYLNEQDGLDITALTNSSGLVNISTEAGSIESAAILNSTGKLVLDSAKDINLSGQNKLSGALTLSADNIIVNNNAVTDLASVTANNVTVNSSGTITAAENFKVNNSATLTSFNGELILNGPINIAALNVTAKHDISLADLTATSFIAKTINGDITATGAVKAVSASLSAENGSIMLANVNNDFDSLAVVANDAVIEDENGLLVSDSQLSNGLVVNANGELSLGTISAGSSMFLDAGTGSILSNQSNLTAPKITLRANTGIGSGSYDDLVSAAPEHASSLNMNTGLLSAINSSSGIINISNAQAVTLTDLRNKGDIVFTIAGDITLQTSQVEGAASGVMQGAIDANYGQSIDNAVYSGNVAILNEGSDSLYTTGFDFNEADITAESLLVKSVTDFGTPVQPIRVRVNNDFILIGVQASVHYFGAAPVTVTTSEDLSLLVVSTVAGLSYQQLIEVESLSEVDPAIFTDVRNYTMDEISVRLPSDQGYEEEDEDAEYSGESEGLLSVSVNK
jgi:filamentous hemagglutinin family protein